MRKDRNGLAWGRRYVRGVDVDSSMAVATVCNDRICLGRSIRTTCLEFRDILRNNKKNTQFLFIISLGAVESFITDWTS